MTRRSSTTAAATTAGSPPTGPTRSRPWRRRPAPSGASARRCRRRRDILTGLLATFICTGLLGLVHSLQALWIVTVLSGVALAGFVALAAYATALAAQEQQDLRLRRSLGAPRTLVDRASAGYPGAWDDLGTGASWEISGDESDSYGWEDEPRRVAVR